MTTPNSDNAPVTRARVDRSQYVGNVDLLSATNVAGWAYLGTDPKRRLIVQVEAGGRQIAQGVANEPRPILRGWRRRRSVRLLHPVAGRSRCQYGARVCEDPETGSRAPLPVTGGSRSKEQPVIRHLTIRKGTRTRPAKLAPLRFPESMERKPSWISDATKVSSASRRTARGAAGRRHRLERGGRTPSHERKPDWTDYQRRDLVEPARRKIRLHSFLSAIHYEPNQRELPGAAGKAVEADGKLILECGVAPGAGKAWKVVRRHDGFVRFPTWELLTENLLFDFAVSAMGPSVTQSGDPIPRFVFHCSAAAHLHPDRRPAGFRQDQPCEVAHQQFTVFLFDRLLLPFSQGDGFALREGRRLSGQNSARL